jgi:peptidoglycan/LPS O-acetylase OafA/YrhL
MRVFSMKQVDDLHQMSGVRIPSLDGLRAFSIALVVLSHTVSGRIPGGYGVFLFFVISGFLITRLMFSESIQAGRLNVLSFYKRRFFRLYPVVIVYCVVIVSIFYWLDGAVDWSEPLSALFYFANYLVAYRDVNGVAHQMPFKIFWSLSVEEHFYLLFPLLFLCLRGRPGGILVSACIVCFGCLGLRFCLALLYPELSSSHYAYMRTEYRVDAVAYGVFLAACCELKMGRNFIALCDSWWAVLLVVSLLALANVLPSQAKAVFRDALMGSAIVIGMASIVFGRTLWWLAVILNSKWLQWLGRLSYSMYVWHVPVHMTVSHFLPGYLIIDLMLILIVSALSYYYVEQPVIRWGRSLHLGEFKP